MHVEVRCALTPRLLERLERHALDLASTSFPENEKGPMIIRREPLAWVGAVGSNAASLKPLRLALTDPDTLDHRAARRSLDALGRAYLVAYESARLTGSTAVVRSGQAIAVLTRTAVSSVRLSRSLHPRRKCGRHPHRGGGQGLPTHTNTR